MHYASLEELPQQFPTTFYKSFKINKTFGESVNIEDLSI
jgi:hypothetical protein